MPRLRINVWNNPVRNNVFLADWSNNYEHLSFSTNANIGFEQCDFTLKMPADELYKILEGYGNAPSFVTNRVRVIATQATPTGNNCAWEGMIYSLSIPHRSLSRNVDLLYNIAKVEYTVATNPPKTIRSFYNDATSRSTFGNKVMYMTLDGSFASADTSPATIARRYVTQHKMPAKSESRVIGGTGDSEITMEVHCVGFGATLGWRNAFNNDAVTADSSQHVKDMLRAGSVTDGNTGAGNGQNNWVETLTASNNTIAFGQQFIDASNLGGINTSGVTVARNWSQGKSRLDIIHDLCSLGNSGYTRMLFRVLADPANQTGKGRANLDRQPIVLSNSASYGGYEDDPLIGRMWRSGVQMPLWSIMAGNWTFTRGVPLPTKTPTNAFEDPRMFWIESTHYDADNDALTLGSSSDFDLDAYLGRLINGVKYVKEPL